MAASSSRTVNIIVVHMTPVNIEGRIGIGAFQGVLYTDAKFLHNILVLFETLS